MDKKAQQIIGFTVAGALLLVASNYSPKLAIFTVTAVATVMIVSHADQVQTAINGFLTSIGQLNNAGGGYLP